MLKISVSSWHRIICLKFKWLLLHFEMCSQRTSLKIQTNLQIHFRCKWKKWAMIWYLVIFSYITLIMNLLWAWKLWEEYQSDNESDPKSESGWRGAGEMPGWSLLGWKIRRGRARRKRKLNHLGKYKYNLCNWPLIKCNCVRHLHFSLIQNIFFAYTLTIRYL